MACPFIHYNITFHEFVYLYGSIGTKFIWLIEGRTSVDTIFKIRYEHVKFQYLHVVNDKTKRKDFYAIQDPRRYNFKLIHIPEPSDSNNVI